MKPSSSLFSGVLFLSGVLLLVGCGEKEQPESTTATSTTSSKEQVIDPSKIQALVEAQSNLENCLEINGTIYDFSKVKKGITDYYAQQREALQSTKQWLESLKKNRNNDVTTMLEAKMNIEEAKEAKGEADFKNEYGKYVIVGKVLQVKQDGLITETVYCDISVYSNQALLVVGYEKQDTAIDGQEMPAIYGIPAGRYQYDDNGTTRTILRFEAGKKPTRPFKLLDVKQLP